MNTIKKLTHWAVWLTLPAILIGLQSFDNLKVTKEKKMKTVEIKHRSEVIDVSAEALWQIVGTDFAEVYKWATSVDHSEGTGSPEFDGASCSTRGCTLNAKGFNEIDESLIQFDNDKMDLTYKVSAGMPGFIKLAQNHWEVIEVGENQSALQMTVTMEMKPFLGSIMGGSLQKNLKNLLPTVSNDLKVYAETGEVSESKRQRIASLN